MFFVRLELLGGEEIGEAIKNAREAAFDFETASAYAEGVIFEHNGQEVVVRSDSNLDDTLGSYRKSAGL